MCVGVSVGESVNSRCDKDQGGTQRGQICHQTREMSGEGACVAEGNAHCVRVVASSRTAFRHRKELSPSRTRYRAILGA